MMEEREGYKPSECVKNVSISHCPPGRGEEMKVEKGGGGGGERCQRSTRQMEETTVRGLVFPTIQQSESSQTRTCLVLYTAVNPLCFNSILGL